MSQFNEVPQPIICDAYAEPAHHWVIRKGEPPIKVEGRREACYYYRPSGRSTGTAQADEVGNADGSHGRWVYRLVKVPTEVPAAVRSAAEELARSVEAASQGYPDHAGETTR